MDRMDPGGRATGPGRGRSGTRSEEQQIDMQETTGFAALGADGSHRLSPAALLEEAQHVVDGAALVSVAEPAGAAAQVAAGAAEPWVPPDRARTLPDRGAGLA
jgi:hypothetical protein